VSTDELRAAAVILTKVAFPEGLAAAAAMNRLEIDAVPTAIGSVAVCRSGALVDPKGTAKILSEVVPKSPVVLLVQRDGQLTASRWQAGQEEEQPSAALMLDGAPPEIEDLLLGAARAEDLPGVVSSVGMTKWRAMRTLVGVARSARRRS